MPCSTRPSKECARGSASRGADARRARGCFVALGALLALACRQAPPPITSCAPAGDLTPICEFQNPEDLAVAGDWLLVSQFPAGEKPGSLIAYRPADGTKRALYPTDDSPPGGACDAGAPPPAQDFAPHGIDLAGDRLLVVNHGSREAIEEFAFASGAEGPTLAWRSCTQLPSDANANDVAALAGGGFVATKMTQRPQLLGMLKLMLGLKSGALLRFAPGAAGWEVVPNSEGRGPNGVEVGPDGTLFIAEWAARRLVRLAPDGSARTAAPLDFSPDNLSWASDGRLLVTGQRAAATEVPSCLSVKAGACALATAVAAVDPQTLAVTKLVDDDPATTVGAGSIAVELGDALWIGTFAGDRLVKRAGTH